MRIALYSDLHLEVTGSPWQPPLDLDADVVVLAGDIHRTTRGLRWAASAFRSESRAAPAIVYVAGNHEFYGSSLGMLRELRKPEWLAQGVHFLECETFMLGDLRFIGCTLWSGFSLQGTGSAMAASMRLARYTIADYSVIRGHDGKLLEPRESLRWHGQAVGFLQAELSKPWAGKTVVVTHFAPHPGCVAPQHQGSDVSPYFVTDLSWLMEKYRVDVWCHGHTHTNNDFIAENGCRVISNQLGYPGERTSTGFRNDLVIEL